MFSFNKKKLTKKVKNIIKSDVFAAMALVSIMFNVFFFSGILLFNSTNKLDLAMHNASIDNLCVDHYEENLVEQMELSSDPALAKSLFEIRCQSGDFERYYDNAVQAFLSDSR